MRSTTTAAIATAIAALAYAASANACEAKSGAETASLIELYTSEGCSSCPPADRWLSQLVRDATPGPLVALAFHVDYWDYIGWRDRFASADHSRRQRERVAAAGGRIVYTPQVMLNGRDFRGWGSEPTLEREVARRRKTAPGAQLGIRLERAADGWTVALDGKVTGGKGAQAWLAVYQDGLASEVKAGENAGHRLAHDRVVRRLFGPYAIAPDGGLHAAARIDAALKLNPVPGGVAAFVQDASSGEVLQALALPFCAS